MPFHVTLAPLLQLWQPPLLQAYLVLAVGSREENRTPPPAPALHSSAIERLVPPSVSAVGSKQEDRTPTDPATLCAATVPPLLVLAFSRLQPYAQP